MISKFIENPNKPKETMNPVAALFRPQTTDFYGLRVGDKVLRAICPIEHKNNIGEIIEINREYALAWNPERNRMEQIKVKWADGVIDTHYVAELDRLPTAAEESTNDADWFNYM